MQVNNNFTVDFTSLNGWIAKTLLNLGFSDKWVIYVKCLLLLVIVLIGMYILQFVVRKLLKFTFKHLGKTTKMPIFKYAIYNRVPHYLALVVPYSFIIAAIPIVFEDFKSLISICLKLTDIYMVFMVIWTLIAIVSSLVDLLQEKDAFKNKPLKSYLQVVQIIFYICGAVVLYSILTGKSVTAFFAAMGAASAVLLLMFQDTIKGFAGSIQLSSNDMVRLGDWITMNKYGADGTVEEINLTTVKVINFDKTITTVPTYALITDSFQNWRGMQESGGRRFKRCLYVNQSDIVFMSDAELEEMKQIDALKELIAQHQAPQPGDVKATENTESNIYSILNTKRLTNNDLFMCYASWYLRTHPRISQDMTLLVRTLAPTEQGLPVELYAFTNTIVWAEYEGITSEVVSHLVGSLKYFNLRIFATTASDDYDIRIKENVLPTKA